MQGSIHEMLPSKDKTALFQCHIDRNILKQVIAQRKADKISWKSLIEACFRVYLDECNKRPVSEGKKIK